MSELSERLTPDEARELARLIYVANQRAIADEAAKGKPVQSRQRSSRRKKAS